MSQPADDLKQPAADLPAGPGDRFPVVYEHLRQLAHRQLRREAEGHSLSTTALVHEAYLRLSDQRCAEFKDHGHFLAIAATAMRRILVDHARRRSATKRGGELHRIPLDSALSLAADERAALLVALDDALQRLGQLDSRQARVIECRFFGGLTEEETAIALNVGTRTVKRDWAKARSWLYQEIHADMVG